MLTTTYARVQLDILIFDLFIIAVVCVCPPTNHAFPLVMLLTSSPPSDNVTSLLFVVGCRVCLCIRVVGGFLFQVKDKSPLKAAGLVAGDIMLSVCV